MSPALRPWTLLAALMTVVVGAAPAFGQSVRGFVTAAERGPLAGANVAVQRLAEAEAVGDVRVATGEIPGADMDTLRDLAETARNRMTATGGGGVAVFGSADAEEGKAYLAASVTDDVIAQGVQAGKLVGALAKTVGGGGGGRPTLATAGGKNPDGLADALGAAADQVRAMLG